MFHSVPGVPHLKMERFARMRSLLRRYYFTTTNVKNAIRFKIKRLFVVT
ncbi:hypothetical protein KXD93_20330 [Mucilaginibacter sp. BJC16-A38]|nr:hypothetical protein [Mucilaginibacter phenanthrenivorans]MCR8560011.1 hypothetical protein [Mucilaginibacter phenanthrenivorans]